MTRKRPEFKAHDDFILGLKKTTRVTREEFTKFIRNSLEQMRELIQIIKQYDQTIESFEENESERELNEVERISKDSERDSKIDGKANKSMLLNPKYDIVYDSCVCDVDTPLDAYSVPMESGHYFENIEDRDSDTTLTYEPDGVLLARPTSRNKFSPVLIAGFDGEFPYFDIRVRNLHVTSDGRFWFIKYKDKDNWVGVMIGGSYQAITVISSVEGTQTEIAVESIVGSTSERQANAGTIYSLKAEIIQVNSNFAASARALRVFKNEQQLFTVPIPTNAVDFPNRVGFSVGSQTEILKFKAGRAR